MTRLALTLSLALAGCYPPEGLPDAQDEEIEPPLALRLVLGFYGSPGIAGPRVIVRHGDEKCGFTAWSERGHCVGGVFREFNPDFIEVAVWDGAAWSQTGLAHEARHWLLFRTTGALDHSGDFYAQVARANELLWRSGE